MKGPESRRRRAVHLRHVPTEKPPTVPAPRSAGRPKRTRGERFMLAAERVLGGLAPTLHLALTMVAVTVAALVVVAFTLGIMPAVLGLVVLLAYISRPR
ncbi:hypothetical protein [Actinokineospora sp. HUAS TT18]|uniref:hypothetical protein n=1 Tax=Actinokineospora sp. HUAS TT18 TaxID=3447451 RepID=UPI003F5290D9